MRRECHDGGERRTSTSSIITSQFPYLYKFITGSRHLKWIYCGACNKQSMQCANRGGRNSTRRRLPDEAYASIANTCCLLLYRGIELGGGPFTIVPRQQPDTTCNKSTNATLSSTCLNLLQRVAISQSSCRLTLFCTTRSLLVCVDNL